ncbi:MAG: hypothetical protein GF311_12990 [Candidatus Lokiarchaeota archaeon]|nr:hypothetical protein [Candidatus Lokiarchaeota archaeon]
MKFIAKGITEEIAPNSNIYLYFDFKKVTDNLKDFWPIFLQRVIDQLTEGKRSILSDLLDPLDSVQRDMKLMKIFRNPTLVNNLLKLNSEFQKDKEVALSYFYDMDLDTKTISDFFYGIIDLALQSGYMVCLAFDELQFLDEIDTSNKLLKLFLEKFIRHIMEIFAIRKLYILISCLQNPDLKEWSKLKTKSKNFASIVQGKEVVLGQLTNKEKDRIVNQVPEKIGFDEENEKRFFTKVKESLMYYLPRDLLGHIAKVLDTMDFVGYTKFEIRKIFEDDARNYMTPRLKDKGFIHIESEPKKVGEYEIDIYAEKGTNRAGYVPKAFGEVTMIKKSGIKGKAEKFANWLYRMKDKEYRPKKGDFAFFVCPPNSLTKGAKEVLDANDIELYKFKSNNVEELMKQGKREIPISPTQEPVVPPEKEEEREEEKEVVIVKESKYSLQDVPGIGPAYAEKLNNAGIYSIKDLLGCNVKIKAKEIYGVGEASLNKWRQNARQISED